MESNFQDECTLGSQNLCKKAQHLFSFKICDREFFLSPGIYFVTDLKKLGGLSEPDRLVRILGKELIFLKNEDCVAIDGNEEFKKSAGCGDAS